jgi:hypothetical protein
VYWITTGPTVLGLGLIPPYPTVKVPERSA